MAEDNIQRRASLIELRAEGGRVLSGTLITYGELAPRPFGGQERIEPGAFGDLAEADVVLNVQHEGGRPIARTQGGGLELHDSVDALRLRATLPATREADDALVNVKSGILRGLSVEFYPRASRQESDIEFVTEAKLVGAGLVTAPAYASSKVEARRAEGPKHPPPPPRSRALSAILGASRSRQTARSPRKRRRGGDIDGSDL